MYDFLIEFTRCDFDIDHVYVDTSDDMVFAENESEAIQIFKLDHPSTANSKYKIDNIIQLT